MEEGILKVIAQAGVLGAIVAFMLWQGSKMFQRIMDEAKTREGQLLAEAMAREERILVETRAREDRLVAERLASENQAQENQEKFLDALNSTTYQFAQICKGVEGIQGRVESVEKKVDDISKDVGVLIGAATAVKGAK